MKNSLKMIAILLILTLSLPACASTEKQANHTATKSSRKMVTLAEDTSSAENESKPMGKTAETKEQASEKEGARENESEKPQEQPKQELKKEETSSAASSIDAEERLRVEGREFKEFEEEVIRLVNEERRAVGLEPLRICDTYYKCVQTRAKECTQVWSHTRPNGQKFIGVYNDLPFGVDFKMVGENLGKKFVTAEQIVKALMSSEPHRRNILQPEYTDVCVAIVMMDESEQVYSKTIYAMAQHFYKKEELK